MKVHYLFSRNEKIGSKLIAWSSSLFVKDLEKIPSHIAILIDEKFVIEAVLESGVRIVPYKKWKEINQELYKIEAPYRNDMEHVVNNSLYEVWGKGYDYIAILYFAMRLTGLILFKIKLPKNNRWSSSKKFFCSEFAARISNRNYSMTTPAKICSDMLKELNGKT